MFITKLELLIVHLLVLSILYVFCAIIYAYIGIYLSVFFFLILLTLVIKYFILTKEFIE